MRTPILFAVTICLATTVVPASSDASAATAPVRYRDHRFASVSVTRDIEYAVGPRGPLRLDVYSPTDDTAKRRATVVWVHGGSFAFGSKRDAGVVATATDLARRGYTVATIDYTLADAPITAPFDNAELATIWQAKREAMAAVRFLRANAAPYGVVKGRIAIGGNSAGAAIALITALTSDDPGSIGVTTERSTVCTAVSLGGSASSVLVGPGDAGALFIHGSNDTVVPISGPLAVHAALVASQIPTSFVEVQGAGHEVASASDAVTLQRVADWLHANHARTRTACS